MVSNHGTLTRYTGLCIPTTTIATNIKYKTKYTATYSFGKNSKDTLN